MNRLNIISPVYFDYPCAKRLMDEIKKSNPNKSIFFYFVDDSAGADKDIQKLTLEDNVSVLRPLVNLGHQRAIVFALRKLVPNFDKNDLIVTMDSDGEDRPIELKLLIEKIEIYLDDLDMPWPTGKKPMHK